MAKKQKKQKVKESGKSKPLLKDKTISIELENMRVVKADPQNWRIDTRTEKGEFSKNGRKGYYGSLPIMLKALFESELLTKKEVKSLKKLGKQVEEVKAELLELGNRLEKRLDDIASGEKE